MTPTPLFVLREIVAERKEAALRGELVTAEDVARRWESHHKVRPLLPEDATLRGWLHEYVKQRARDFMGDVRDPKGSRIILSPIALRPSKADRGYIGREAMPVGDHINLGNHQVAVGTRKRTEGINRLAASDQAIQLGRSMAEPLGELAAGVSAEEDVETASR
jgi:hypothetical protein